MQWIAPPSKDTGTATLEKRLWEGADDFRANSGLTSAQYSEPVLGLIFLRFADAKFAARRAELEKSATGRRVPGRFSGALRLGPHHDRARHRPERPARRHPPRPRPCAGRRARPA